MTAKSKGENFRRSILAHIVLIILSFMCLFFFYILFINATHAHSELQKGFSALPGGSLIKNFKSVANDGTFPMIKGILNSLIVSGCSAAICTYFSSLTAYGLFVYDFKVKKAAFTFIMAILVMPTQVTAMGFLRLITNMGMYDSLLPLIIPSIASPAVFYFMYSYLQSSLPLSLVEASRIDGCGEFRTFNQIPQLNGTLLTLSQQFHCLCGFSLFNILFHCIMCLSQQFYKIQCLSFLCLSHNLYPFQLLFNLMQIFCQPAFSGMNSSTHSFEQKTKESMPCRLSFVINSRKQSL